MEGQLQPFARCLQPTRYLHERHAEAGSSEHPKHDEFDVDGKGRIVRWTVISTSTGIHRVHSVPHQGGLHQMHHEVVGKRADRTHGYHTGVAECRGRTKIR
jgi:hypothetical protein